MSVQSKSIVTLILIVAIMLSVFSGCSKEITDVAGTFSGFESQAHFQVSTPEDGSASDDTSQEPLTGEFVVSDNKYDYNGANLELLRVENQTNRHFNVTIHGKYLDANGDVLTEETQTYTCFPAGWSNYF